MSEQQTYIRYLELFPLGANTRYDLLLWGNDQLCIFPCKHSRCLQVAGSCISLSANSTSSRSLNSMGIKRCI